MFRLNQNRVDQNNRPLCDGSESSLIKSILMCLVATTIDLLVCRAIQQMVFAQT